MVPEVVPVLPLQPQTAALDVLQVRLREQLEAEHVRAAHARLLHGLMQLLALLRGLLRLRTRALLITFNFLGSRSLLRLLDGVFLPLELLRALLSPPVHVVLIILTAAPPVPAHVILLVQFSFLTRHRSPSSAWSACPPAPPVYYHLNHVSSFANGLVMITSHRLSYSRFLYP